LSRWGYSQQMYKNISAVAVEVGKRRAEGIASSSVQVEIGLVTHEQVVHPPQIPA